MPKKRKVESSSEEPESEEESSEWDSEQSEDDEDDEEISEEISDPQVLQDRLEKLIFTFCLGLRTKKEVPKNIEGVELQKFAYERLESCLQYAERKLDFKKHGLFEANYFIRHTMKVGVTCALRKIDANQPNTCDICGKQSKVLKQDYSNYAEVVSECSGMTTDNTGWRVPCTRYHCYACSKMPEPYDPDAKRWCMHCNTPEKIAESLELMKAKVKIWDKDKEKAPVIEVEKDVVAVFGGGRGNVTLKHAQALFNLPKHKTPTIAQMNRAGTVEKDASGNFDVSRKLMKARPEKEKEVLVRFAVDYKTKYVAINELRGKTVKVNFILDLIKKIFSEVKKFRKRAKEAIDEIEEHTEPCVREEKDRLVKEWTTKIDEELEDMPLGSSKKKQDRTKKILLAKANKKIQAALSKVEQTVTDEVKKLMHKQSHAMNHIKERMNDVVELLRIVKNEIDTKTFNNIENKCDDVWDIFKCDFIKEEKEVTDDEPEDNDDSDDSMVDNAADNEAD